jgi:hypothetical protein
MADRVDEFWRWFVSHDKDVREAYESRNTSWLDTELSARVERIAQGTSWEIGPYSSPDNTLVLSPGTRKELAAVKAAVARAPQVRGWHFVACKPPKDLLSLTFELENVSANADSWVYRMTSYNGGEFADLEIFFEPSAAPSLGKEATLCELVVEALVGEELRLDRIGAITPVSVPDVRVIENTTAMKHLRPHLIEALSVLTAPANERPQTSDTIV